MIRSFVLCLVSMALMVPALPGAPIFIENHSFEDPALGATTFTVDDPPGWIYSGADGQRGVWNITGIGSFPAGAPDGSQVGYLWQGSLTQTLGATLAANTDYTLQVDFTSTAGFVSLFTIELLAGGVTLDAFSGLPAVSGIFENATINFSTAAVHALLGQPLGIRISSSNTESDFDNVRLDGTSREPNTDIPETGTLVLVALGLSAIGFRRRTP